jgi:hypothetical protein
LINFSLCSWFNDYHSWKLSSHEVWNVNCLIVEKYREMQAELKNRTTSVRLYSMIDWELNLNIKNRNSLIEKISADENSARNMLIIMKKMIVEKDKSIELAQSQTEFIDSASIDDSIDNSETISVHNFSTSSSSKRSSMICWSIKKWTVSWRRRRSMIKTLL